MERFSERLLERWLAKRARKPLIIRGARQVGKSTLVRNFARSHRLNLVEVNLERYPLLDDVFKTNNLKKILAEIEAHGEQNIRQGNPLLFLDEIQAAPHALPALRYFYEEMPELPVIAAGSLLEFILAKHRFSMPVGRIEYLHMGPMTFREFLLALHEDQLLAYLERAGKELSLPEGAHQRLIERQREYLFIGGMPEGILAYCNTKSLSEVREIHRSIIQTYQDDFAKYAKTNEWNRLHRILDAVPRILGKKIVYSKISPEDRSSELKLAVDLLVKARLLYPAYHSDCSGLPLKAGRNERIYKLYFLDVGLFNYLCGLDWQSISRLDGTRLINEGVLAEQFIAQHLVFLEQGLEPPELFYWLREGISENAEVDFVISSGDKIVPLEVKAGKSGSLKSLQQFVVTKKGRGACRFDLNPPSRQEVSHQIKQGPRVVPSRFTLISLPLYLVEELPQIIRMFPSASTIDLADKSKKSLRYRPLVLNPKQDGS